MKVFSDIVLCPFSILYVGFGNILVNKGVVINANSGEETKPTLNGDDLTDAWKGSPKALKVSSGDSVYVVITHDPKDEYKTYQIVPITGAEIRVGEQESSMTETVVMVGTITYDSEESTIIQYLNSDIYIAVHGTVKPSCE